MKIVHFSTSLSRSAGGLLASVSGLARAQLAHGADVTVVGGADSYFEQDRAVWGDVKLEPHAVRFGSYGLDPRIAASLRRHRPDVLHIHGIWSAASVYGVSSTARAVVVSPRGMLDPWILARRPLVKATHALMFERPLLRRAHVHALNEAERQSVVQFAPVQDGRCFVLPNGIGEESAAGSTQRSGALFLGRLHGKKQVLQLIEAWEDVKLDQELTVAGWGTPEMESLVAHACGRSPSVTYKGALYGAAKAEAFEQARLFVLPSLSEGMPIAVLEALQHGCIPVITAACNLPELFADDIAIRIDECFRDFGPIMHHLFALPASVLERRSNNARSYAMRYHWVGIARGMLDQYATILARGER